jgi:hypothetical protein
MGRQLSTSEREALNLMILSSLNERLDNCAKELGWSKTKIVEYALDTWLSAREKELGYGLVQSIQ